MSVDLVDLEGAPPLLAYEAISKGILVVDKDLEARIIFEVKAVKEYMDLKPRLERYYREKLGGARVDSTTS